MNTTEHAVYLDPTQPLEARIQDLLSRMTLEEKVSMAAGADMWHSVGIERLGIPAIKVTDGPNGARGGDFGGGVGSACFPVGICLGSTWNTTLIERVGKALAQEVRSKQAHVLLAPTVNIHRSPLNGRNFECYSEDPFLTARIAAAYITGLQSEGVGACIKHYCCNDSEFERHSISSEVGERALREIYLPPFETAVREIGVWAVMSAYNKVNGTYCSENPYTLLEILKGEWGFEGIVISDWGGTYSTVEAAANGLDLEMPGPARWMGEKLLQAVRDREVSGPKKLVEAVDDKVRRLLRTIQKAGAQMGPEAPEQAVDRPEHRALIRQAAGEGIVLLKNDGVLPLDGTRVKRIAVIGPNAAEARIMGGGSAQVKAHYAVSPLNGIRARAGDDVEITYALGCTNHREIPELKAEWLTPVGGGESGWTVAYYNNLEFEGDPVRTETIDRTRMMWFGQVAPGVDRECFSARLSGTLTVPESGTYILNLNSVGVSRLTIDGALVLDNWTGYQPARGPFDRDRQPPTVDVELVAGQGYALTVEYSKQQAPRFAMLGVGCMRVQPPGLIEHAAEAAAQADVALVFVGTSGEWESEGFDRPDMELPGRQVELVEAVAAANPNTIVVLNTGSPVSVPWLDKVAALVEAWFPGQECGNAVADVLFGDVNPSGRLSQTWPMRLEDNPAFINYPGENGRVLYGEGLFVGYRYYEKKQIEPRFPFGYGLSYTTFEYGNLRLQPEYALGEPIAVSVDVTNSGPLAGQEVVQLYVRDEESRLVRPEKELKAFAKLALAPRETQTVTLTLDERALSFYDDAQAQWVAEAGAFTVLVGASSHDIRCTGQFTLTLPPDRS